MRSKSRIFTNNNVIYDWTRTLISNDTVDKLCKVNMLKFGLIIISRFIDKIREEIWCKRCERVIELEKKGDYASTKEKQ